MRAIIVFEIFGNSAKKTTMTYFNLGFLEANPLIGTYNQTDRWTLFHFLYTDKLVLIFWRIILTIINYFLLQNFELIPILKFLIKLKIIWKLIIYILLYNCNVFNNSHTLILIFNKVKYILKRLASLFS